MNKHVRRYHFNTKTLKYISKTPQNGPFLTPFFQFFILFFSYVATGGGVSEINSKFGRKMQLNIKYAFLSIKLGSQGFIYIKTKKNVSFFVRKST
jgi:hypothetical protein